MMYGSWDAEWSRQNFLLLWITFGPFTPLTTWKSKFWKNKKKLSGDIIILYMYHKWQSYIWFLRYGAQQTKFFVILDHFLPFSSTNNPKNKKLEKIEKKIVKVSLFYTSVPKIMMINYTVPAIDAWQM